MAPLLHHALGHFRQPLIWKPGEFLRDVDLAAFARVSGHPTGHESRGRPALFAGGESAGGARLAVHPAWSARARLEVLRGGGLQSAQPVVDRDAGHCHLHAAHQLDLAAGNAGHRCCGLPADARRVCGLHPGARFGQSGDGLLGPSLVPAILDAGYNFDFTDDGAIAVKGITHKILIVPNVERIPLATLQKISGYAAKGGKVLFTGRLPSMAPGLRDEGDTPAIRELAGKYQLTEEAKLGDALHAALPADFTLPPNVGAVHRKLPFADIYFLANTSNRALKATAAFRVQGMLPAWWDPFTGKTAKAGMDGDRVFNIDLAPYESRVLVFSRAVSPPIPAMSGPAIPPVDVSSNWTVKFADSPQAVQMATLRSWTDDEARKFYSGTATYQRTVAAPEAMLRAHKQVFLNFGEGTVVDPASERRAPSGMRAWLESPVREAAQVFINGKAAGAVWKAPFEVEITTLLKPGENTILVVVANLALNVLAKGPLPDYKELTAKY